MLYRKRRDIVHRAWERYEAASKSGKLTFADEATERQRKRAEIIKRKEREQALFDAGALERVVFEAVMSGYFLNGAAGSDLYDASKLRAARQALWYDFLNAAEINYDTLTRIKSQHHG